MSFCRQVWAYYKTHHFKNEDGTFNKTISPIVMERIAASFSFDMNNRETQLLDGLRVYPTTYLLPRKKYPRTEKTFAEHRIYGSWRKKAKPTDRLENYTYLSYYQICSFQKIEKSIFELNLAGYVVCSNSLYSAMYWLI